MKNAIIIILGLLVIGSGVYFYLNNNSETEEKTKNDIVAPKEIADFIPTEKELTNGLEERIPEVDGENLSPVHSRTGLLALLSATRVELEIYYDEKNTYSGSCGYFERELLPNLLSYYNSRSVDGNTGVKWYQKIESVPGLKCNDSINGYALEFETIEDDLSSSIRCFDSKGYYDVGFIGDSNFCVSSGYSSIKNKTITNTLSDSQKKENINKIRILAEMFKFDNYSFIGFCNTEKVKDTITNYGGKCFDKESAWASEFSLNNGSYFCADYNQNVLTNSYSLISSSDFECN